MNDERMQRGLVIAATSKLTHKGSAWLVPSQTGNGKKYTVCPDVENPHCTCLDHETRGLKCKHIFAVEITMKREEGKDGSATVTQTVTITETVAKRKTYPQKWEAYNEAQTHEKEHFLDLLHDLCKGIQEPPQSKGRPRLSMADSVFACCFKIFSTFSGRRFMSDLRDAHAKGFIDKVPHFNSIFNYLENPSLTPILKAMIVESSRALSAVEVDFAGDSTGFSVSRFLRWFDMKYGVVREKKEWVKVHLTCGVKTNIVTAVVIEDKNAADSPQLPEMVKTTAQNFKMREYSADKAYGSVSNYEALMDVGAMPFIAFKSNHTGAAGGLWEKMFHYFSFRKEDFLSHYHKRSNIESTNSMIKAKFRDNVRSKGGVAMKNEVLAKIVCHNICCIIQEMHELGIEPEFWAKGKEEGKDVLPMIPA